MVMGANSYSVPYHEPRVMEIVELRNLLSYSSPTKSLRQSFSPITTCKGQPRVIPAK